MTTEQTEAPTTAPVDGAPEAAPADDAAETSILGDAGAEPKAGETDAGEGDAGAETAVPEKYDLTAPEGMEFDTEAFAAAEPVFREIGLTNEAAQKLMPVAGEFAKRVGAAAITKHALDQAAQFNATKAEWAKEAQADAELGGANWNDTVDVFAAKALDSLGFPKGAPLREYLTETGLGNHPEMIRLLRRVGERVSEAGFVTGGHSSEPLTREQKYYGNRNNGG